MFNCDKSLGEACALGNQTAATLDHDYNNGEHKDCK